MYVHSKKCIDIDTQVYKIAVRIVEINKEKTYYYVYEPTVGACNIHVHPLFAGDNGPVSVGHTYQAYAWHRFQCMHIKCSISISIHRFG